MSQTFVWMDTDLSKDDLRLQGASEIAPRQ